MKYLDQISNLLSYCTCAHSVCMISVALTLILPQNKVVVMILMSLCIFKISIWGKVANSLKCKWGTPSRPAPSQPGWMTDFSLFLFCFVLFCFYEMIFHTIWRWVVISPIYTIIIRKCKGFNHLLDISIISPCTKTRKPEFDQRHVF